MVEKYRPKCFYRRPLTSTVVVLVQQGELKCQGRFVCTRRIPICTKDIRQQDVSCVGPKDKECPGAFQERRLQNKIQSAKIKEAKMQISLRSRGRKHAESA